MGINLVIVISWVSDLTDYQVIQKKKPNNVQNFVQQDLHLYDTERTLKKKEKQKCDLT